MGELLKSCLTNHSQICDGLKFSWSVKFFLCLQEKNVFLDILYRKDKIVVSFLDQDYICRFLSGTFIRYH